MVDVGKPGVCAASPATLYGYPPGPAANNGADIFRAAVGADDEHTYWRIDWITLIDPSVPIAAWTFDTDDDPATGSAEWPAAAGVRSAGHADLGGKLGDSARSGPATVTSPA